MSFHEVLLNQRYWGMNFFSILGLVITLGIGTSCICRLNAMHPRRHWRITLEAIMYMVFAAWSMECFMDLIFLEMFSGFDIAIGTVILLHLHTTYKQWEGDDCICDLLNYWREERRERRKEIAMGVKFGRRETDEH